MKRPTKFVKPLTDEQRQQLNEIIRSQAPYRRRMRAHAVLLSERRYPIDQIADIFQVDRDRVSQWLDWWDDHLFDGLDDDPRRGRPPILNDQEQQKALKLALKEPRSLCQGLHLIATKIGKVISRETLKRLLTGEHYSWKRMRRSLRSLRDEAEFRAAQSELAELRQYCLSASREFDLWYFDEAGFTLQPCIPYAWQQVGETFELASTRGPRQNVLGFFNLQQQFHCYAFKGSIDTHTVIECLDLFSQQLERPALVILDNGPVHTSDEFADQLERWEEQGVYLKFLPPYCPELNLIEILWRKIKYEWLPLDAYENFKTMTRSLFEVLRSIGSKYRITFA